jgi:hypothetical protein
MAGIITDQNRDIKAAWDKYIGHYPINNQTLAHILKILPPEDVYFQDYNKSDLGVKVI